MIAFTKMTRFADSNQKMIDIVATFFALQCHGRGRTTATAAKNEKTT
jgi:hypothetical protein